MASNANTGDNMKTRASYVRNAESFETPGFYVCDDFAHTFTTAVQSGPFATFMEADDERTGMNIAGDCSIVELR